VAFPIPSNRLASRIICRSEERGQELGSGAQSAHTCARGLKIHIGFEAMLLIPKVLDRAMVLEFDEVNLERLRSEGSDVSVGG
jgi:hypothetical protein